MDDLSQIRDDVRAIKQALLGFDGHGGLLTQVERLERRVGKLEQWRWATEGLRTLVAALAGLFGGKWSG